MKTNINEFLKKNNSIFAYLKDANGNKSGVIIASKVNEDVKIGYAFFYETATMRNLKVTERITCVSQAPNFAKKLMDAGVPMEEVNKLKFPEGTCLTRFDPSLIRRDETILLARKRANTNRDVFYRTNNSEDPQSSSIMLFDEGDIPHIEGSGPKWASGRSPCNTIAGGEDEVKIYRRQIKNFEYRAFRYYKIVTPPYKK